MTFGWITLDVGEQALVYDLGGRARIEEGPKRLFLWRQKYSKLQRFAATQTHYLKINYRDGRTEHMRGPLVEFCNPVVHSSIHKCDMVSLDANEALIVYATSDKSVTATRRIEYGPTLFMPKPNEWMHKFLWHGTDPDNKTRFIPKSNQFTRLKIIPDQFYYNVDEIRTSDDALMRVKLMMFYELQNIEQMLDSTVDPIADFINCLCADVVAYAASKTYLEFIEQAGQLNDLKHYPRLVERCQEIGFGVSKVVYRGYHAHDKLQQMHDQAIVRRTELKLTYEKVQQEQTLVDSKLQAEESRMKQEQKIAKEALQHKQEMESEQSTHKLAMEKEKSQQALLKLKQDHEAALRARQREDEEKLSHLGELHTLGVDVNQVLLARSARPQELVQVVSAKDAASLHLHY